MKDRRYKIKMKKSFGRSKIVSLYDELYIRVRQSKEKGYNPKPKSRLAITHGTKPYLLWPINESFDSVEDAVVEANRILKAFNCYVEK